MSTDISHNRHISDKFNINNTSENMPPKTYISKSVFTPLYI